MARVSIEQLAFSDRRFATLGRLIGGDRWAALGRLAAIWNVCQTERTYCLTPEAIVDTHPDLPDLPAAILKSDLGESQPDGTIRVKGTIGRTEWLGTLQDNGKYGALGAAFGKLGGRPKKNPLEGVTETPTSGIAENPPPAPALTPTKKQKQKRKAATTSAPPTIADLIKEFSESKAFPGIDITQEALKASLWLKGPKGKGRHFTWRFFFNWLGRADRTILESPTGNGKNPELEAHSRRWDKYCADHPLPKPIKREAVDQRFADFCDEESARAGE